MSLLFLFLVISPLGSFPQISPNGQREVREHFARAQQALKDEKPELAAGEFQAVLKLDPKNIEARANLGVVAMVQARYAEASQYFREVLALEPSLWKAQALMGICERHLGKVESALTLLEKSFPHLQDPRLRTQAGMNLVEINYQRGDLEAAADVLRTLQQQDPTNLDVLFAAYRTYSDIAAHALDTIALVAPNSARMHQVLAQHLVNEGDIKGAIAQYREAVHLDPRLSGAHFELGEAILQDSLTEQSEEEAQKEFEVALGLRPDDAKAECRLGGIYALKGDSQEALRHYSHALELNPKEAEAQVGVAKALMMLGEPEKGREHLLEAIRLDPMNSTAHYRLSQLYRQLGRLSDAEHETATFKELRETRNRMQSAYLQVHKPQSAAQVLNPDIPQ